MISEDLRPAAEALLAEVGFPPSPRFQRIDGGGNNQVFLAESGGRKAALKAYFHHPQDQRDRLNAEYAFSTLLWNHGIESLPRPLAVNRQARLGLYEFVEGQKLAPAQMTQSSVEAALNFFLAANTPALHADGHGLPVASEACFSIAAHLATVSRRLARLEELKDTTPVDREAAIFLRESVQTFWRGLEDRVMTLTHKLGLSHEADIAPQMRCISPSDFGFHNALRESSGTLRFVDFEYAGWDDPAKLVGDFFNQVQVPVPASLFEYFARRVAEHFPDPRRNYARFEMLLPVYSVKWIAIMLNDFLPVGGMRRSFAGDVSQAMARKQNQLAKAQVAFARLNAPGPAH